MQKTAGCAILGRALAVRRALPPPKALLHAVILFARIVDITAIICYDKYDLLLIGVIFGLQEYCDVSTRLLA